MTLTELIAAHPEWDGLSDFQVAEAINAKNLTRDDEAVLLDDMEIMRQLGTVPGHQLLEKIETRANVVDTTGITIDSQGNDSTTATVWLSGGTAGQEYAVTNRITTTAGRTDDRTILITVVER